MHTRTTPAKPPPPFQPFPLFWHKRGYWCIKRDGRQKSYGSDAQEAYRRFLRDEEARQRGDVVDSGIGRYGLRDAVNVFLTRQLERLEEGKIGPVQFAKYRFELERELPKSVNFSTRLAAFSNPTMAPELFSGIRRAARARGLQVAQRHIIYVRAMLEFAVKRRLMLPPSFGDDFDPPSAEEVWKQKYQREATEGVRAWPMPELRRILAASEANPHTRAQVLLGVLAGYGSDDCSALLENSILWDSHVIRFPRAKNGRPRLTPMTPRLEEALRASLAKRPAPAKPEYAGLVFLTENGTPCNLARQHKDAAGLPLGMGRNDTIGKNFQRLLLRLNLWRKGRKMGFKSLRAMFRSLAVGKGDGDLVAVLMGRRFRDRVDEYYIRADLRSKLFAVVKHVETQIFPTQTASRPSAKAGGNSASASPARRARPKPSHRASRR